MVAVGLFYSQGYFKQRLDASGWQQEDYLDTKVENLPIEPALSPGNEPVTVTIATRGGDLKAKV
jgi:starch phosphorylase